MTAALHRAPLRPTVKRGFDIEAAVALRAPCRLPLRPAARWRGIDVGVALRAHHHRPPRLAAQ